MMRIYHLPPTLDDPGRVICLHDALRMLSIPPDLPFIEIDASTNMPLYHDVLLTPGRYLVDVDGKLLVDEDYGVTL